jgi:LysM repeat protein
VSPLTDPPFVAPPTGWTEEMEAAARRPRPPAPPPRRRWRVALRVSAWGVGTVLVLAGIGTLLFIHRSDAEGSARVANREVELMLERGETIDWRAPVMARHWWHYFRVTHGVLVATNRRLLYVGVPPADILPREPEPQLLEESSFPFDRPIDIWRGRVFLGTLSGVVIRAPGQMRTFGVASSERVRLDSVLTLMSRRQKEIRDRDEDERQKALASAQAVRRPVYHVVQRGEALELLARQYDVTVEQLLAWNNLQTPRIRIGQNLLVKPRT